MPSGSMGVLGDTLWNNTQNEKAKPLIASLYWLVLGDSICRVSVVAAFLSSFDWLVNTLWLHAPPMLEECTQILINV